MSGNSEKFFEMSSVIMPATFVGLLKTESANRPDFVVKTAHSVRGLTIMLERSFAEFDEFNRGLDKIVQSLGWPHFRDRLASLYVYKMQHGPYPAKTDMSMVESIKTFESKLDFVEVNGLSRLFLLAFYLKLMNIQRGQENQESHDFELLNSDLVNVLSLNQSRAKSDRPDWLVLMTWHFVEALGVQKITELLKAKTSYDEIYNQLSSQQKKWMTKNLLAYGLSINEEDVFTFEKV